MRDNMTGLITSLGKNTMLNRTYKSSPDYTVPSIMKTGASSTTPLVTDTALVKPLPWSTAGTTIDACDATSGWAQGGDGSAPTLNTTTGERKEGPGSLNLPATYSTGTATWSKTISSTDLSGTGTSEKYIYVYFYISSKSTYLTDSTSAVRLIIGTSGYTNYDYFDTDYDDLSDGWNLLVFKTSDHDGHGGSGATLAAVDSARIQVACKASMATTVCRMDWWHYCNESAQAESFTSGYPTFNETNRTVTTRAIITSTQCNNYTLTEVGSLNTDSTRRLQSRDTYTAIDKTSSYQVAYILISTID
jgi:hypothetical protein